MDKIEKYAVWYYYFGLYVLSFILVYYPFENLDGISLIWLMFGWAFPFTFLFILAYFWYRVFKKILK